MITVTVGELLRQWRERRRLSQLELSIEAEVSTRHISFVETGRSQPSRELILHLSEHLDVPLRERNRLLLAAGFAPVYAETALDAPRMAAARNAVRQILKGHEPYPAVVLDRAWNLVAGNDSARLLTDLVAPDLLAPPANVLRASLHPRGLAPHIANLPEWRAHLLARLRRQVDLTDDPDLRALAKELEEYPSDGPETTSEPDAIVVPLKFTNGLSFFGTIATFGTPLDVTLAELSIESFYPADEFTAEALKSRAS
jgi:transcriptional regulator with XRE-family HTH domain